jgi:hypothetical protein
VSTVAERGDFLSRGRERCSSCGSTGRAGQLICLTCGERMALRPRGGAPRLRPAVVAGAAIVVTAGAAVGMVIEGVGGRDQPRAASLSPPAAVAASPTLDRARVQAAKRRGEERTRRALAEAADTWPAGRSGYTVVLLNTGDRAAARRFARSVSGGGENAGVITGRDHPNLAGGLFLVYAGTYKDQAGAAGAAARLGESYPGAYAEFVQAGSKGSSSGRPAPPQSP